MSTTNTSGPAFPTNDGCYNGMTLRDYFAAKAMQAILSDPAYVLPDEKLAVFAYYVADTMLEAREQ